MPRWKWKCTGSLCEYVIIETALKVFPSEPLAGRYWLALSHVCYPIVDFPNISLSKPSGMADAVCSWDRSRFGSKELVHWKVSDRFCAIERREG